MESRRSWKLWITLLKLFLSIWRGDCIWKDLFLLPPSCKKSLPPAGRLPVFRPAPCSRGDAGGRRGCRHSRRQPPPTAAPVLLAALLLAQAVQRGRCVPEPGRTSLLLLARITLEQTGSSKHFHSCLLVPHCYCLPSHIGPSAAVESNSF